MNKPTIEYVRDRLRQAEGTVAFRADPAVAAVFAACRNNREDACVIAKVAVLNALYGTRILNIYHVVNHILELDIDERLRAGDESLVSDVAWVKLGKKRKMLVSFASKYCHWHQPDLFQIFDSRVEALLWAYQKRFLFAKYKRAAIRDYPTFARVMEEFRIYFGLTDFTRKQIDKFLWIEGGR